METSETEEELILLAKSKDPAIRAKAFDGLIRAHHSKLRSQGIKLLGKSQDVDDAITATTEKAMRCIDEYEYRPPFWAWLSKVHYTTCYDRLRVLQKENKRLKTELGPEGTVLLDLVAAPQKQYIDEVETGHKLEELIQRALGQLSEKHRNIILMVFVNEYQYQQVANLLNVEIGTVMSRVSNARKFFKWSLLAQGVDWSVISKLTGDGPESPSALNRHRKGIVRHE